jgi:transcriptional regulator with XRE-family HTH domain
MDDTRRRRHVGVYGSAAVPIIWEELDKRGWSHADLARELDEERATIARVAYGDRKAGRALAAKFQALIGVPFDAWDKPLPRGWRPLHRSLSAAE